MLAVLGGKEDTFTVKFVCLRPRRDYVTPPLGLLPLSFLLVSEHQDRVMSEVTQGLFKVCSWWEDDVSDPPAPHGSKHAQTPNSLILIGPEALCGC